MSEWQQQRKIIIANICSAAHHFSSVVFLRFHSKAEVKNDGRAEELTKVMFGGIGRDRDVKNR